MRKATHMGTCQVCGSHQKLPKGLLSLHGYTTRYGFFEGTCPGSSWAPWELSKDLAEQNIVHVKRRLEAEQERLADPDSLPKIVRKRIKYSEKKVVVKAVVVTAKVFIINFDFEIARHGQTPEEFMKTLRAKAVWTQEHLIGQLEDFINWQTERCAAWMKNPDGLTPIDKNDGRPVHLSALRYRREGVGACVASASGAQRFAGLTTKVESEVTCKRCLKSIENR